MSVAEELTGDSFTADALSGHYDVLAERVFQIERKWPHFGLLLEDIRQLADACAPGSRVVSFERGLLYGGCSLIAPFFQNSDFISLDCSPQSANSRGAYNAAMTQDPRFLFVPTTHRGSIEDPGLADQSADLILVPNLVHHVANQDRLFAELARITAPGGQVYVFEPLLRELHQEPDDYLRWTPYGMARAMTQAGLEPEAPKQTGGPFEAIAYCWAQALEYFPEDQRVTMAKWFYDQHMPELMAWDKAHTDNQQRDHTSFPVAFSLIARKPR